MNRQTKLKKNVSVKPAYVCVSALQVIQKEERKRVRESERYVYK